MNGLEAQVEQIVREVTARIAAARSDGPKPESEKTSEAARNSEPKHVATPKDAAVLEVSKRVVSLADVSGKLWEVKQLVVARGAVITPAVRDLLRHEKIDITYKVAEKNKQNSASPVCVGVAGTKFEPAALFNMLRKSGIQLEQIASTGLVATVEELAEQVRLSGRLGLLLTGESAPAICLANRVRGVRAVAVASMTDAREMFESVGANFLILDPKGKSQHELQRTVSEFCSGSRQCPPPLRAYLN